MKVRELLENVAAGFVRMRPGGGPDGNLDAAVAAIALMIASLDGNVLPEEFAAYRWIVGRGPGGSEAERKSRLEAAIASAGRLLLMAQVGVYSDAERIGAFADAARGLLPNGFAGRSSTDVRRSFVFWLSMAISDGEFSDIERQAVMRLRDDLAAGDRLEPAFFETAERLLRLLPDPDRRGEAERELDRLVVFEPTRM